MNTYRISITLFRRPDRRTQLYEFDVDALRPSIAIKRGLNADRFDAELMSVSCQLYAKNIFPLNDKVVRAVGA